MALHSIMEDDIPGVQLKAGLPTESLEGAAERGAGEAGDGFFGYAPAEGVAKVDLSLPLAGTEAAIEQP